MSTCIDQRSLKISPAQIALIWSSSTFASNHRRSINTQSRCLVFDIKWWREKTTIQWHQATLPKLSGSQSQLIVNINLTTFLFILSVVCCRYFFGSCLGSSLKSARVNNSATSCRLFRQVVVLRLLRSLLQSRWRWEWCSRRRCFGFKAKVKFLSWRHSHLSNWDWRETEKEKKEKNSFITLHNSIIQFAHNIPSTILLLNSLFADWSWKYLNSQLFHIVSKREKNAVRFCVWENSFYDRTQYRMNLIGYIRIMKRAGVKNS